MMKSPKLPDPPSPFVASTVPPEIFTAPAGMAALELPEPMPAAYAPPPDVMLPPVITILSALSRFELTPPPMPAAFSPPCATIVPPSMTILPGGVKPPAEPMPAAFLPPKTVRLPSPLIVSVDEAATSMPAAYCPFAARMLSPSSVTVQAALDTTKAEGSFLLRATIVRSFSVRFATLSSATTIRKVPLVETPLTVALLRRANTLVLFV